MNRRFLQGTTVVLLAIGSGVIDARAESTISCPPGTVDVLDWMTLDADLRGSKRMSHLSTLVESDKSWWIKGGQGKAWDIFLYDSSWIYLWITEDGSWLTPDNYKRHYQDYNVRFNRRCARSGYPGEQEAIDDPGYMKATDCVENGPHPLGRAVTGWWGPYTAGQPGLEPTRLPIGGDIPDSTVTYTAEWRWDCDSSYNNCPVKEEFILTKRYGLVRWNEWVLQGGRYVLNHSLDSNELVRGAVQPDFDCPGVLQ